MRHVACVLFFAHMRPVGSGAWLLCLNRPTVICLILGGIRFVPVELANAVENA